MRIEHVALWVRDLEMMRAFYAHYLKGRASAKYVNDDQGFESYFLSFEDGARLELMRKRHMKDKKEAFVLGWAHIAFSLGSNARVDALSERLNRDGYALISGPRVTGDGYYESVIEDPEGNRVELIE